MCNDYANTVGYREMVHAFSRIRVPLIRPGPESAPNLEPRLDIRPTDMAPIVRPIEGGVELTQMRWGFAPPRPKGAPVINFRAEGRKFVKGRCLIPASAFYEFTGARYPKTKWRFTLKDQDWFCLAGLWRAEEGGPGRFTMLTTGPGPDMQPYHDRQVVVLGPDDWSAWLGDGDPEAVLRALPAGSLAVEKAVAGAEEAPDLFGG